MKILQVTPFYPPDIGGIADHVYNIANNMIAMGENVTIIAPQRLGVNNKYDGFNVNRIPSIYLLPWPYSTLKNFSIPIDLGLKIDKLIKRDKFDIVHIHGQHYPSSWVATLSCQKHRVPSILTVHTTFALNPKKLGGETLIERCFNQVIFSRLIEKSTGIIGLTENNVKFAKAYGHGDKFFEIPNGIDTISYEVNRSNREKFRKSLLIDDLTHTILFCGRFEDVKGIVEFASAAKQLAQDYPNVRIIIIGNGSLKQQVTSILHNTPRIDLIDWQEHDLLVKYYILSDIFVIPSKFEGLPIVLLEAMAALLHIIFTPVGSMPEFLRGYAKKTQISKCDTNEIYHALVNLIKNPKKPNLILDHEIIGHMRKFDWNHISKMIKTAYETVIDKYEKN